MIVRRVEKVLKSIPKEWQLLKNKGSDQTVGE